MRRPLLVLLVIASVSGCSKAAPPGPAPAEQSNALASRPRSPELAAIAERVKKAVDPQIGRGKNPGAVIGFRLRDEVHYLSFGEVKLGTGIKPDSRTVFEVGSVTKTFTGLLLADAIESGLVKENERLDAFRPEWRGKASGDIRLIDLVTHRAGLARLPCNIHSSDKRRPYADYTDNELVDGLAKCEIGAHPSEAISYSNWGFATLGFVLGERRHATFEEMLRTRITGPFALRDTSYTLSDDQKRRLAQGYDDDGKTEAPLWDRKAMMGNGAIRSTAEDLLAYGAKLLHPETAGALGPAIRRALTQKYSNSGKHIGYAWFRTSAGSWFHTGETGGFTSHMKLYPSRDLTVVVLTNRSTSLKCVISAVEDHACDDD